jgi:hypothetical protein
MSTLIKQFELAGVYSDLQFGKHANYLSSSANAGALTVQASDNSALANLFVAEPTAASHAATKNYVDNAIQGLDVKSEAQAASVANITATYANGTAGVGATLTTVSTSLLIDGYTVSNGDRILVKNQTASLQNGIYTVSGVGTAVVLTRATDADTGSELASAFVFVRNGTTMANTGWTQTTNPPITIGTSPIVWAQFSGAGSYTAGDGLTLTGGVFSVNVDNVTTAIISNDVVVAGGTSGNTLISTGATEATWGQLNLADSTHAVTGILAVGNGGSGRSSLTNHGVLVGAATSPITQLTVGTNFQVLIGNTGADPSFGSIDLSQSAAVGSSILHLANGGTNANLTAVAGAVTYSTASALALSAAGTVGQVLLSGGASSPTWSNIGSIAVTTAMNEGVGQGIFDSSNSTSSTLAFKSIKSSDSTINVVSDTLELDLTVNPGDIDINTLDGFPLTVAHGGTGKTSVGLSKILYSDPTLANTFDEAPITTLALNLLADSTTSAMQSTLGLVIGTNVQAWSTRLDGLAALNSTGFMVQTGSNTYADRTITVSGAGNLAGLAITNGNGVSAAPNLGLDINGLAAASSLVDTDTFPIYSTADANTNRKATMAQIAAKVLADYPVDPLFATSLVDSTGTFATDIILSTTARATRVMINITEAYDVGYDMQIVGGSGQIIADTTDIDLQTPGIYLVELLGDVISGDGADTVTTNMTPDTSSSTGTATVSIDYRNLA